MNDAPRPASAEERKAARKILRQLKVWEDDWTDDELKPLTKLLADVAALRSRLAAAEGLAEAGKAVLGYTVTAKQWNAFRAALSAYAAAGGAEGEGKGLPSGVSSDRIEP